MVSSEAIVDLISITLKTYKTMFMLPSKDIFEASEAVAASRVPLVKIS